MSSVHRHVFVNLVNEHRWTHGAELGVDKGILFGALLRGCPNLHLTGVDTFPDHERSRRVFELANAYVDRSHLMVMTTHEASALMEPASLDFVFIDADHSYDAVKDDIALWRPKVKTGGWLGGHDYHPRKFPGVVKAVDEAFEGKTTIIHYPGTIWGLFL